MGLTALLENEVVLVSSIDEGDLRKASRGNNLSCHFCLERIVYKHGQIKIPHFAHYTRNPDCDLSNETLEHLSGKLFMMKILPKYNTLTALTVEKIHDRRIYDVYAEMGSAKIAVELQHTVVSSESIEEKINHASQSSIHVLYVLIPGKGYLNYETSRVEGRIIVKESELYLHRTYFGRVYYTNTQSIQSAHFLPATTYVEGREWYDSSGNQNSGGGYEKNLKSRRNLQWFYVFKHPETHRLRLTMNGDVRIATLSEGVFWKK